MVDLVEVKLFPLFKLSNNTVVGELEKLRVGETSIPSELIIL